ncbi:hypothetical protein V8F20_003987 [Naviculisporaceae sp. PSN 640]
MCLLSTFTFREQFTSYANSNQTKSVCLGWYKYLNRVSRLPTATSYVLFSLQTILLDLSWTNHSVAAIRRLSRGFAVYHISLHHHRPYSSHSATGQRDYRIVPALVVEKISAVCFLQPRLWTIDRDSEEYTHPRGRGYAPDPATRIMDNASEWRYVERLMEIRRQRQRFNAQLHLPLPLRAEDRPTGEYPPLTSEYRPVIREYPLLTSEYRPLIREYPPTGHYQPTGLPRPTGSYLPGDYWSLTGDYRPATTTSEATNQLTGFGSNTAVAAEPSTATTPSSRTKPSSSAKLHSSAKSSSSVEPSSAPLPELPNYWPDIFEAIKRRQHAKSRHSAANPSTERVKFEPVICKICNEAELVIRGLQKRRSKRRLAASGKTQEQGVLAACGHVFGRTCLKRWRDTSVNELGRKFTCPMCRFDLNPDRCDKHGLKSFRNLAKEKKKFGLVTNNVQPDGHENAKTAEKCLDCSTRGMAERERADLGLLPQPEQFPVSEWTEAEEQRQWFESLNRFRLVTDRIYPPRGEICDTIKRCSGRSLGKAGALDRTVFWNVNSCIMDDLIMRTLLWRSPSSVSAPEFGFAPPSAAAGQEPRVSEYGLRIAHAAVAEAPSLRYLHGKRIGNAQLPCLYPARKAQTAGPGRKDQQSRVLNVDSTWTENGEFCSDLFFNVFPISCKTESSLVHNWSVLGWESGVTMCTRGRG